jgi:hypothetical protein
VHESLNESVVSSERAFETKIIASCIEWEKLVTVRFEGALFQFQSARRKMESYQKEVDSLLVKREKSMAKLKDASPPSPYIEHKMKTTLTNLERATKDLVKAENTFCRFVDEHVDQSWRELYPVLVRLFQLEMSSAQDRATALSSLQDVLKNFSDVARDHDIKLKDDSDSESSDDDDDDRCATTSVERSRKSTSADQLDDDGDEERGGEECSRGKARLSIWTIHAR